MKLEDFPDEVIKAYGFMEKADTKGFEILQVHTEVCTAYRALVSLHRSF